MPINIDPVVSSRISTAWNQLPAEQKNQIGPLILAANQQAVTVTQLKAASGPAAPHELILAHSAIYDDPDGVARSLPPEAILDIGPDGVIWGTGKYQQFDPGWAEAFACYLESFLPLIGGKVPFVDVPQTIPIKDNVQIALIGDWGTGDWRPWSNPAPSSDIRTRVNTLQPHITIHLGDVYYAGTGSQQEHLLVNLWPQGTDGSFALNSNHEMYSGAKPYFDAITKQNSPFQLQKGCSYFALENRNWVIIALDTAYFAPAASLYRDGRLSPDGAPNAQSEFLHTKTANAQEAGKKVILLTHHNGLDDHDKPITSAPNVLWNQIISQTPEGSGPDYWYWGHNHAGVIYKPQGKVQCRCCGHGGIPWGYASQLDPKNNPQVLWRETRLANDPDIPKRVLNGFAMLYLEGPSLREVFYDENGGVAPTPL